MRALAVPDFPQQKAQMNICRTAYAHVPSTYAFEGSTVVRWKGEPMQLAYTNVSEGPVILPLPLQSLEAKGRELVPAAALLTSGTEEPLEH